VLGNEAHKGKPEIEEGVFQATWTVTRGKCDSDQDDAHDDPLSRPLGESHRLP
jgi:hypothetical protein